MTIIFMCSYPRLLLVEVCVISTLIVISQIKTRSATIARFACRTVAAGSVQRAPEGAFVAEQQFGEVLELAYSSPPVAEARCQL